MSQFPETSRIRHHNPTVENAENEQSFMARGCGQINEMIRDNSSATILGGLAAGFGIGLVVGQLLGSSAGSRRKASDSTAREVGHRILEGMSNMLPDTVSKHLHK